jgi:hypothetical protein
MSRRRITAVLGAAAVTLILASGGASGRAGGAPGQQSPTDQTPPSISGSAVVTNSLTASTGTWQGKGLKYAYQWLRCDSAGASCGAISGATGSAEMLSTADVGDTLRVIVTASNRNGSTAATSAQTAVVASAASPPPSSPTPTPTSVAPAESSLPVVSGTAQQNQNLTTSTGSWSGTTPMTYSYQWQRCDSGGGSCAPISGATAASYALAAADVGSTLRASVTASNSAGSATDSSDPTAIVSAATATSTQDCENTFGDDFETVASTGSGLNASACPTVSGTVSGDFISQQGTWFVGSSGIKNVAPPTPGSGSRAVQVSAPAGSNATWANHWRHIQLGQDYYYGMMWYFPSGWIDPAPNSWEVSWELNYHPYIWGNPIGISTHGKSMKVGINTGQCVFQRGCSFDNGGNYENATPCGGSQLPCTPITGNPFIIPVGQMNTGVWHEIILHVHWAADTTGHIEAWWKRKGEATWNHTVNLSGFPTVEWGQDLGGFSWTPNNINGVTTDDHFGVYRDNSNSPGVTYYLDDFHVNTSFNAVAATLP